LVIGGAGTIGSSYIKAILKYRINKLVVVDINEHSLTQLKRDLRNSKEYHRPVEFITYQINVNDRVFEDVFLYQGPFDIVANFAQLKHLANENDLLSVETIIENNIFGTRKLLEILYETPPKHFFSIAPALNVNTFSIMGASNKLMEDLIMAYSDRLPIITARLANVAFSNGSLLSGFLERFNKKQHLTCPIGVSKSYISPKESGEFCLIATIMGASGDIFFPKLDESVDSITFDQIAIDLIRSQGFEPDVCHSEDEAREKAASLRPRGTKREATSQQ
jgi:FlaA1/EpsC-like NDP-sugar epimerase